MVKSINESFFDTWTEESAYILGYIWADGCLTRVRGALRVSISSNDEEIIRKINRAMSSEYAITLHSGTYSTGFAKPYMIEKLQSFGLIERKSKTIGFPTCIPSEYLRHFIRGYFDGNGHFSLENSKRDGVRYSSGFTLGSKTLAEELRDVLHEMGLTKVKVYYRDRRGTSGRGEYYEFRYYQADTQKLSDLIYKDATIFMERKKNRYGECLRAKANKALVFLFVLEVRKKQSSILLRKRNGMVTLWRENRSKREGNKKCV